MCNKSKFHSTSVKFVMIFVMVLTIIPLSLYADGFGTFPPPPDSTGDNNSIIIDTTANDTEIQQSELSLIDSLTLKLFFFIVL